ncbi:phospholipase C [Clostridium sp. B9]|uniref:phospholipase C n=1 Tax=Clostridium sp. B9 TaxID=3423224 RepID=UPI003D2EC639
MKKNICKALICAALTTCLWAGTSTKVYAWDGKPDGTGTHAMIVTQGVTILENDLSKDEPSSVRNNLEILKQNIHELQVGSTYPDYDKNAYDLYQDHFWDPDTNSNFSKDNNWYLAYSIPDTGESQIRKFTALARYEWRRGNYKQATFYLGEAMHYFGDIDTPYHPANVTAVDSLGHVKFETFAEERKEQYKINTTGSKTNEKFYTDILKNPDFATWSKEFAGHFAKIGKSTYYSHASMSHSWEDWDKAARLTLSNSQKGTAGYIYRFLHDVSEGTDMTANNDVKELVAYITTSGDKDAGTDDYMYFGIKTKGGQTQEWKMDNPGNDFMQGSHDTYTFKLRDENLKIDDIENMWIRKSKFTAIHDDYKPENIKIIANGKVEVDKDINQWISGNSTFYIK